MLLSKLRSDDNEMMNESFGLKTDSNLNIWNYNNKIIIYWTRVNVHMLLQSKISASLK